MLPQYKFLYGIFVITWSSTLYFTSTLSACKGRLINFHDVDDDDDDTDKIHLLVKISKCERMPREPTRVTIDPGRPLVLALELRSFGPCYPQPFSFLNLRLLEWSLITVIVYRRYSCCLMCRGNSSSAGPVYIRG